MPLTSSKISRRTLFASASTVGALAATVSVLPSIKPIAPATPVARAKPEKGGGYDLSEHVKQYYKTALV